jgi:predicted methyltransferase
MKQSLILPRHLTAAVPPRFLSTLLLLGLCALFTSTLQAAAIDEAAVLAAMSKPGRLADDIKRDSRSKPQAVIPLLNLQTGDRVIDIFGSGGYYSELLATVLGESGEAVLHNNSGFEAWGINGLTDRFDGRDPGNITRYTRSGINLDLDAESLDGVLLVMALHDLYVIPKRYNGEEYVRVGNPANMDYFLEQVYKGLKPGGRFVVVDHAGDPDSDNETVADLHRIIESFARQEIEARGFRFVASTDALRNPADSRANIVFDEEIQGRTDRFVLVFEK